MTVPAARDAILAGLALAWARALGEFGATITFAGNLAGRTRTLPLEIFGMTTNVTTPVLYALGTVTTMVSLLIIGVSLTAITLTQRRRSKHGSDAGSGMV